MPSVTYCGIFAFFWRSVAVMGGCFLDCFRVHRHRPNRRPRLVSNSSSSINTEEAAQKIRISSLFADEGTEKGAIKDRENLVRRVGWSELDDELLEEANFLKASGTLPQTPVEFRKSYTLAESLGKAGTEKLPSMESSPKSPEIQKQEICADNAESMHIQRTYGVIESSPEISEEIQEAEASVDNVHKSDVEEPRTVLKSSPHPTPWKITEDMQTPGTIFATNMKNLTKGNARIRCQYVKTTLNPIESISQQQELKEETSVLDRESAHKDDNLCELGNATLCFTVSSAENSVNNENMGDATLASWLKPPRPNDDSDCNSLGTASTRKPNIGKDLGDRPIIGLVAAHWNEQGENSNVSPKWWNGNGIPNSTTKYKEDQKVRWHATPFEERLEKALSEETSEWEKKPITGMPIMLEEMEAGDTTTSHIQSVSCTRSVVSF